MTTETRFIDLLGEIPRGNQYDAQGNIIPFNNITTSFSLVTNFPNDIFRILVNDVDKGLVETDANGNALFSVSLPRSDIELILERQNSTDRVIAYLTARDVAVWIAAIAKELEGIDDAIDLTLDSHRLADAASGDIEAAHGARLLTPNDFNADLEAYRESLQLMRQTFRQFAGRLSGKKAAVAAITQVNPLIFDRTKTGPRWVLGFDLTTNGDFQDGNRDLSSPDLATEINVLGAFVTLGDGDGFILSGGSSIDGLKYNKALKRFRWTPPNTVVADDFFGPGTFGFAKYAANVLSPPDGKLILPGGHGKAAIHSVHLPHTITANEYDHLYLQVDNLDIVPINLSFGGTLSIDVKINGWLQSIDSYRLSTLVTPSIVEFLVLDNEFEVVRISDNTPVGAATLTTAGVSSPGNQVAYTAPGDVQGPDTDLVPGGLTRAFSDNGVDFVDVLTPPNLPAAAAAGAFTVANRYSTSVPASLIASSDQLQIESQIGYDDEMEDSRLGSVTVHDGPANAAAFPIAGTERGIFDIPKIATTLSSGVSVGNGSITVPAGAGLQFSSADGEVVTPFDAIIGYGYQIFVEPTFSMVPDPTTTQFANLVISGTTFGPKDTHVVINAVSTLPDFSRNLGPHKIVSIDSPTAVRISYGGVGIEQPAATTGVSIIKVSTTSADGTGTLDFTAAGTTLAWTAPGDAIGVAVAVGAGGYFRIFSSDTTQYIDVLVDASAVPGGNVTEPLEKGKFLAMTSAGSDRVRIWSAGERVTVTDVATAVNDTWTLESNTVGSFNSGTTVYLADGQFPLREISERGFGDIEITVDNAFEPTGVPTEAEATVAIGTGAGEANVPNGWLETSSNGWVVTHRTTKFSKGTLYSNRTGAFANRLQQKIELKPEMCGFTFTLKAWVRSVGDDGIAQSFRVNVDFGVSSITGPTVVVSDPDETVRQPALVENTFIVPVGATEFTIEFEALALAQPYILEKVVLVQESFTGLFLGNQTTPRSPGRSNFGSLLYVWSPDELTTTEETILGIDAPSESGLIRETHNAHEEVDAFDITDIVLGDIVNLRGAVTEADWIASTRTNMEIVGRQITRFSYVKPEIISQQTSVGLAFTGVGPWTATLTIETDEDQTKAILFEDGIPVPNDEWSFTDSTTVEISTGFNASAVYTINYQALIRVETAPIDLVVPADNGNDTWFPDFLAWSRHRSEIDILRETVSLIFNASFVATLNIRSDQDKLNSVLTENTGVSQRIIPKESWTYLDSRTIRINGAEFNSNAIYSLEYNQQLVDPNRVASITVEVRSAASVFSLGSATYREFGPGLELCVDTSLRYHQIRVTISDVGDTRDVRIHSATLRGLNMTGTGSPPPGF